MHEKHVNMLLFNPYLMSEGTLRFHKIILNGRGHVLCVCFDFSRPFFSLLLFHNPAVHNHNQKILVWQEGCRDPGTCKKIQ